MDELRAAAVGEMGSAGGDGAGSPSAAGAASAIGFRPGQARRRHPPSAAFDWIMRCLQRGVWWPPQSIPQVRDQPGQTNDHDDDSDPTSTMSLSAPQRSRTMSGLTKSTYPGQEPLRTIRATTYCEEPGECRFDRRSRVLFQRKVEALKHSSAGHRRGNAAACQASRSAASVSGRFGEVIAVQVRNSSPPGRRSTIHQPS